MKRFLLFLLVCPVALFAQMYNGTVTLVNGDTKTGYVALPKFDDAKIKFSETEHSKTQKLKIDEVKGYSYTTDGGEIRNYVVLEAYNLQKFSSRVKNGIKLWLRVATTGKSLNLIYTYYDYTSFGVPGSGNLFFIQKPGENTCDYVYNNTNTEAGKLKVYDFDVLKANIVELYGEKWAAFVETITERNYTAYGLPRLVKDYDAYTAPKKNDPGALTRYE